jgi:hypothetical protein
LITSAGNKVGPHSSLIRHSIAQPTADMQHRSVQHHHLSGRSMTRNVCLLPTPSTLQRVNQPLRPHTGRWKCLQRTRRTNQARSPRKGAHSQSTTFKDTPQAKRTNSKGKYGARERVAGKVHIYGSAAQQSSLFFDLMQTHTRSLSRSTKKTCITQNCLEHSLQPLLSQLD